MRVIVCGDRNYTDREYLFDTLDSFGDRITEVIEGGAFGADTWAYQWAEARGVPHTRIPAQWGEYGEYAGPLRNRRMLDLKPDMVLAFHKDIAKSKGTKHMLTIANRAGVPTQLFSGSSA
jgi:hypothetical protein